MPWQNDCNGLRLLHARGQKTVINIAPSTTTHSVVKNPILKAAFSGADLFKVETFSLKPPMQLWPLMGS
jgi:hypothetical protein